MVVPVLIGFSVVIVGCSDSAEEITPFKARPAFIPESAVPEHYLALPIPLDNAPFVEGATVTQTDWMTLASTGETIGFGQGDNGGLCLVIGETTETCLLYTSPSPRDATLSRMPSSA